MSQLVVVPVLENPIINGWLPYKIPSTAIIGADSHSDFQAEIFSIVTVFILGDRDLYLSSVTASSQIPII